jgi:uncharacterized protein (TIGR01319 family)
LLVDVGSTFTKCLVVAPDARVLGQSQSPTTIENDVLDGVVNAVNALPSMAAGPYDWALASSSAAGGLRMASVGLTASLSGKAGELSALGAGAKVVSSEHGLLDEAALERIEAAQVHLVLLAGGIDGGNSAALLHNARMLSKLESPLGYIVAGNADASPEAGAILRRGSRDILVVGNVFPKPGEIRIPPTREAVRDLFLRHITRAKGLSGLLERLKTDCEPTPLAVSRAVSYVSESDGPVVFVDLGGATTDVHSLGGQTLDRRNTEIPTPDVMRTVEGDLGMRWGAPGITSAMSAGLRDRLEQALECDLEAETRRRHDTPGFIPADQRDRRIDDALASAACTIAIERHAGRVIVRHRPWGDRYSVVGKDLRSTRVLVATGGAFRFVDDAVSTVIAGLADIEGVQAPKHPEIAIDSGYTLYAIGLLARYSPVLARQLAARTLLAT